MKLIGRRTREQPSHHDLPFKAGQLAHQIEAELTLAADLDRRWHGRRGIAARAGKRIVQ